MDRRQVGTAGDAPHERRHATSPCRAALLVVVGLLLGALLTAPALLETARSQPYGATRTVLVEVMEVIASASSATRLDVPWRTMDAVVHRQSTAPVLAQPDTTPVHDPPPVGASERPPAPAATPAAPTPTAPVTPVPPVEPSPGPAVAGRVPTAGHPLRVWIAGDSMWERPGPKLVAALTATGVVDVVGLDVRYSTGLTRPDFFDWPAHAQARTAALRPEVVLFLVGPNDSQPLVTDGLRHEPRTEGFAAAYTARVRQMMAVLAEGTDHVVWVGLPVMRDAGFDQRMVELDHAYAGQAGAVRGVQHVPTRQLFTDGDGAYSEYLPDPGGAMRPMRNRDGIHLSDAGAARLAHHLLDVLDDRHGVSSR